jgi:hypothetical protein
MPKEQDDKYEHALVIVAVAGMVAIVAMFLVFLTNQNTIQTEVESGDLAGQAIGAARTEENELYEEFKTDLNYCTEKNEQGSQELINCVSNVLNQPEYINIENKDVIPNLMEWLCGNVGGGLWWECNCPGGNLGGSEFC